MRTITIEVPDQLPATVAASDEDLAREFGSPRRSSGTIAA